MKKLKISLASIAFVFAIAAAFAFKPAESGSSGEPLYWFDENGAYTNSGLVDQDTREGVTGCSGSGTICEEGYKDEQLAVSGQPAMGIALFETAQAEIPKTPQP